MVIETGIEGVLELRPRRFDDDRGYFEETYNQLITARAVGQNLEFVQDNESLSHRAGTVRGLHYQLPPYAQAKLIRVISGSVVDVAVDIRPESPTYLQHVMVELTQQAGNQLLVPKGCAHGFCTLEPETRVGYKVTDFYRPEADRSLHWLDPRLAIGWPVSPNDAVLSERDRNAASVEEMEAERD